MSEDQMREAAIQAADRAIDRIEERKGLRFNGLYDPEVAEIAEAVLTAAAPPIEAAVRERDAVTLRSVLITHARYDIRACHCGWAELGRSHIEHVVQAWQDECAAIARAVPARGETGEA